MVDTTNDKFDNDVEDWMRSFVKENGIDEAKVVIAAHSKGTLGKGGKKCNNLNSAFVPEFGNIRGY